MKNITTTQKMTLIASLVVVGMMFGYVQFYNHIRTLQEEFIAIEQELNAVDVVSAGQQEVKHFLTSTKEAREGLKKHFVSTQDPTLFWNQIDTIEKASGVVAEKSAIEIDYVEEGALLKKYSKELQKEVSLVVSVEGSWEEVHHFVELLERFPYAVTLSKVSLELSDDGLLDGPWKGRVYMTAHAM